MLIYIINWCGLAAVIPLQRHPWWVWPNGWFGDEISKSWKKEKLRDAGY